MAVREYGSKPLLVRGHLDVPPTVLKSSISTSPKPLTLEEAVNGLVPYLDGPVQEFLRAMQLHEGVQPYEYILGYIHHHYEMGLLSYRPSEGVLAAMGLDPLQVAGQPTIASDKSRTTGECKWCHKEFKIERLGQQFCPDVPEDSEEISCGRQHVMAELHKRPEYHVTTQEHLERAKRLVVNKPNLDAFTAPAEG